MKSKSVIASLVGRSLIAGAIAAGTAIPAAAAEIFLRLDDIQGESRDDIYKSWIELLSYTQSFRNAAAGPGGGGGATMKGVCGDITVMKVIDRSSPSLIGRVLSGQQFKSGDIVFREAVGARIFEYYKIKLSGVQVMAVEQTDRPDPPRVVESVLLRAVKFEFEYVHFKPDGTRDGAVTFGWDCASNSNTRLP